MKTISLKTALLVVAGLAVAFGFSSCKPKKVDSAIAGNAAEKVYVAPGKKDELYLFTSGGFSGQIGVYGLPSGRLLREIPVFSQRQKAATVTVKRTLWDDSHHPQVI